MKWLHVAGENFLSWEKLDLPLENVTAAVIVGHNGAGKSSTIRAGIFALFGERHVDELVRDGAEKMEVTLTVQQADRTWRITRGRSTGKTGKSWGSIRYRDGSNWTPVEKRTLAEVDEFIEENIVGMDRPSFEASIYSAQGEAGMFARMDPAGKKEMLQRLLGLGRYEALSERAKELRGARSTEATITERQVTICEQEIEQLTPLVQSIENDEVGARMIEENIAALEAELEQAIARERIRAQVQRRGELTREMADVRAEGEAVEKADARRAELVKALAAKPGLLERVGALETQERSATGEYLARMAAVGEERTRAQTALAGVMTDHAARRAAAREQDAADRQLWKEATARIQVFDSEAEAVHSEIVGLVRGVDGRKVCPECGQTVEDEKHREMLARRKERQAQIIRDRETAIAGRVQVEAAGRKSAGAVEQAEKEGMAATAAAQKVLADIEVRVAAIEKPPSVVEQIKMIREQVDALTRMEGELDSLPTGDVAALKARHRALRVERDALPETVPEGRDAETIRADQRQQDRELADVRARIARAEDAREAIVAREERAATQRRELDVLREQEATFALLQRAYGRDGIPQLLLDGALVAIEAHTNAALEQIGASMTVEVRTQRTTKAGTRREVVDVIVQHRGRNRALHRLSGGEQFRVFIALRAAIAEVLAARTGLHANILIIDELTDVDEQGAEAIGTMLPGLDRQVLLVTHDPRLIDLFPSRVQVVHEEPGGSRLTVT